jgi:rhamnogalacturonan acetylesterase
MLMRLIVLLFVVSITASAQKALPTVYIVGDSTVNNSSEGFQGWGNAIGEYFDKTKIDVVNRARGGRSSRTFFTEGLWDQVMADLKPGDFVLIQFGHNDGGPVDKEKYRGSLKGMGDEVQEVSNETNGKKETIHTFGWYMKKYALDAKNKGAKVILISPVPRNVWKDGKVVRASADYGLWAKESAKATGAMFLDLNEIVAKQYEEIGQERVGPEYFTTKDHTHTSPAGAKLNAVSVIRALKKLKGSPLKRFILKG